MDHIFPRLHSDYDRWRETLALNGSGEVPHLIKIDDVLRAHYLLCDYFIREGEEIAVVGPRDPGLLASAVARQAAGYGGELKWRAPCDQVATLFYGLVKNHAFHDGNKRTALLTALLHITRIGRTPTGSQKAFEEMAVRAAGNMLDLYSWHDEARSRFADEHDRRVFVLSRFFRKSSRDADKKHYFLTFHQLDTALHRFGFRLAHPDGNFIDVVRDEQESRLFGLRKRTIERRVVQVGFPGWTKEVPRSTISLIRTKTELTVQNGYDSEVFFRGADPLAALISRYHGPLMRLKDK